MSSEKRSRGGCAVAILAIVLPVIFLVGLGLGAFYGHLIPASPAALIIQDQAAHVQALDARLSQSQKQIDDLLKVSRNSQPANSNSSAPSPAGASTPHVALLTDYGTDSIYVGLLTGAIYTAAPNAAVSSITNAIPAYDMAAGAYVLAEGCVTYPPDTVFCCVIDPGVGTSRRPIAMQTNNGWRFVAPDNGILTLVAQQYGVKEVRELTNQDLWRVKETSTTFHGRDIFGPVTGALAAGTPFEQVGNPVTDFVKLELPVSRVENGAATGEIVRIDTYGNVVTNIPGQALANLGINKGDTVDITVGDDHYSAPFVTTYGDVPQGNRLVVIQSAGFIELAANRASLADAVQEGLHAPVTLRKAPPAP